MKHTSKERCRLRSQSEGKGYSGATVKGRQGGRQPEKCRRWRVSVDFEVKESILMIFFSLGFGNQNKLSQAITMLCMLIASHAIFNESHLP